MIGTMDNSILNFKNLSILNLSNNKIKRVQNLPATLRELYLTNNEISEFEALKNPLNSLIHIGLAYNKVNNQQLAVIVKNFPNLFCIDLSFNELNDLGFVVT